MNPANASIGAQDAVLHIRPLPARLRLQRLEHDAAVLRMNRLNIHLRVTVRVLNGAAPNLLIRRIQIDQFL